MVSLEYLLLSVTTSVVHERLIDPLLELRPEVDVGGFTWAPTSSRGYRGWGRGRYVRSTAHTPNVRYVGATWRSKSPTSKNMSFVKAVFKGWVSSNSGWFGAHMVLELHQVE